MKRVRRLSLYPVALLLIVLSAPLFALHDSLALANSPPLIISEIKIRNDSAGLDEFIELYNPTDTATVLNNFVISYVNLSSPAINTIFDSATVGDGLLEPGHSLVLAKDELDPNLPNAKESPFGSLSDSGGTIRLTNTSGEIIDEFSWTSTAASAVSPIQYLCTASNTSCNLNKTQSFQRGLDTEGNYLLTGPTWQLAVPTPESSVVLPLPETETESEIPTPAEGTQTDNPTEETPAQTIETTTLQPPQITELLPNPAPPASDSTDEFIEIYNPNNEALDLKGFRLESGNTFTYKFTFGSSFLQPLEYKAFKVTETGVILSNSSGQVRLIDPAGNIVAQTNAYSSADDGQAWALVNGTWQWTTTPTPNAANVLTLSPLKVATAKATTKKTTKVAAKKKTTAAKTKKPAAAAAERQIYDDPAEVVASLHPAVLAGIGSLTLVYAAYEYRHDVQNRLQQFRRNREIRHSTRS